MQWERRWWRIGEGECARDGSAGLICCQFRRKSIRSEGMVVEGMVVRRY